MNSKKNGGNSSNNVNRNGNNYNAGYPSTTGNPSGGGRRNDPSRR